MSETLQSGSAHAAAASPTLDDLFRRTVARQPDALALTDPPNKQRIVGQPSSRLTYAQADRAISALAGKFLETGLPIGSIVAVQLPNTIEFPLTVLAALRAGMIVALLPQLWRQSELTTALNRVGARAIVGMGRIELVDHAELALNAAVEVFSIRQVFGFGGSLPDGMMQLGIVTNGAAESAAMPELDPRRAAIISFDMTADGLCAVPRSHVQLIAGGLATYLESGMAAGSNILSTLAPSSFGGLALSMMPWLLSGGALALHHAGDLAVLEQQIAAAQHDALILPAPLALKLAEAGAFSDASTIRHVIGVWRTPEQMASSANWPECNAALTDILLFGEIGLIAARRQDDGAPAPINAGIQHAPRGATPARAVGELIITPKGKLAMQGVMVPVASYQKRAGPDEARPEPYADTGYGARLHRADNTIEITSPPGGMVGVGGYRFLLEDLEEWAKRLGAETMLAALPDQLNGHRLAGRAQDARRVREVLGELGLNPLMVGAFRNRTDTV